MKRLGKLVFMGEAEYAELAAAVRTSDKQFACGYQEGFNAGKFHSAGGYAHALLETRGKLAGTTATMQRALDLLAKWRPFVEALETYHNQYVEIGFDNGLHFPEEVTKKNGEKYVRTVSYAGQERKAPCKN